MFGRHVGMLCQTKFLTRSSEGSFEEKLSGSKEMGVFDDSLGCSGS
jgi:hypothetical protein